MLQGHERFCDGCGQKLQPGSMLSRQTVSKHEAAEIMAKAPDNADGTVTVDLCLDCRVKRANRIKHGY
jgi:hypothetical protein